MSDLLRRHTTARIMSGRRPLPLLGRLLADTTRAGEVVPLDPDSGGEEADGRPAFILSTEAEASDGHILRLFWDTSRSMESGGPGIPVLDSHNTRSITSVLGQWQDIGVRDIAAEAFTGSALIGRTFMDTGKPEGAEALRQIRAGFINSVSVGWQPGERVRRGDLDTADPLFREAEDDFCDQPAEGFVMGTPSDPNRLVEGSLTGVPSQQTAAIIERLHTGAAQDLQAVVRGSGPVDVDRLLAYLSDDPRVRAWVARMLSAELERRQPKTEPEWALSSFLKGETS